MEKITHSRLAAYRTCPRKHFYRYELGLEKERQADPLRFGTAVHNGLEAFAKGATFEASIEKALDTYEATPSWADPYEWEVERETVGALLAGYFWRWTNEPLEHVEAEREFDIPLTNPDTGRASQNFTQAGKIDGVIRLADGRLAVLEHKTAGLEIESPDSPYWLRLRIDPQISTYMLAARAIGYDVETCIYNVIRKPTIRPRQIPTLDADGKKIVRDDQGRRVYKDANKTPRLDDDGKKIVIDDATGERAIGKGGKPRQTAGDGFTLLTDDLPAEPRQSADLERGWTLETEPETPADYGARLLEDIYERPHFYYQRREIPRPESTLDEHRAAAWMQAKHLRESQKAGRWYPNVSRNTCDFCEFSILCLGEIKVDPAEPAPTGYRYAEPHSELEEV